MKKKSNRKRKQTKKPSKRQKKMMGGMPTRAPPPWTPPFCSPIQEVPSPEPEMCYPVGDVSTQDPLEHVTVQAFDPCATPSHLQRRKFPSILELNKELTQIKEIRLQKAASIPHTWVTGIPGKMHQFIDVITIDKVNYYAERRRDGGGSAYDEQWDMVGDWRRLDYQMATMQEGPLYEGGPNILYREGLRFTPEGSIKHLLKVQAIREGNPVPPPFNENESDATDYEQVLQKYLSM